MVVGKKFRNSIIHLFIFHFFINFRTRNKKLEHKNDKNLVFKT